MKKAIALILSVILMGICGASLLQAAEVSSSYPTLKENSVNYACNYNTETKKIEIDGTVNHDVLVAHNNYEIEVYRIAPNQTFADVIVDSDAEPLAITSIAIKFHISIEANRVTEKFSKYAIVFRSSDGERILAAEPQYAGIDSDYQYSENNRSSFKGITSSQTSVSGNLKAGTTIIPVYWNRLLNSIAGGYIYPFEDSYCYFDKTYIDELDAKIRSYSASGTQVYLQMLLPASESNMTMAHGIITDAQFDMPDLYDEDILTKICACTEFLSQRYQDYQSGTICGMILGKQVNNSSVNYCENFSLAQYAERYAFYLLVVANSARLYQSDLDIVVPFGNIGADSESSNATTDSRYLPRELLETILTYLNETVTGSTSFNLLIESSENPLKAIESESEHFSEQTDSLSCHAGNLSTFMNYLQSLENRFSVFPQHVIYLWTVPNELNGKALACNYLYSYFRLLQENQISSFVVSFEDSETPQNNPLAELSNILRYIDTAERKTVTQAFLSDFEESERTWLSEAIERQDGIFYTPYRQGNTVLSERDWLGTFSYMDFTSGNVGDWFCGNSCKEIKADYGTDEKRALHAVMKPSEPTEISELIGLFEYPENYIYTPFIRLTMEISDLSKSTASLYEVVVTLGNAQAQFTSEYIVHGNEETQIWLDLSEYNPNHLTDYIKIDIRMLSGNAEEYSLWFYGGTGYSTEYSSDELAELIALERLKIREQTLNAEINDSNRNLQWMVFGILTAVTIIGIGGYLLFQKHREKEKLLK